MNTTDYRDPLSGCRGILSGIVGTALLGGALALVLLAAKLAGWV